MVKDSQAHAKKQLAELLGAATSTVQNYESGSLPNGEMLVRLSNILKCSTDWLLLGEGERRRGGEQGTVPQTDLARPATPEVALATPNVAQNDQGTIACDNCELVLVPMLEAVLSGGTGSMETGGAALKTYAFRYDFLKRKGNPKEMGLFRVSGDSMADDILDNDVVLIDKSQNQPVPGKIFAVSIHGLTYLKQVDAGQDGLILSSANERYAPITVDLRGDEQDGVYIIGRMVWLCREFD